MISEKNQQVAKYVVAQFLRKKTYVVTKTCCVLLAFLFPDFVWCLWHIIKQIFNTFALFNIKIIHPR